MAAEFVNYYVVLGIDQAASAEQVKAAIKQQRGLWVPRQQAPSRELQREAEDQLANIRAAEKLLLDPAKRAKHDREIDEYIPPAPERQGDPGSPEQRDWVADAAEYLRRNHPEAAAGAAREATERNGRNDVAWALRGRASLRLNQADSAIFEFGEAVRLKPGSDEYHCDLGSAYEAKHSYAKAIDSYKAAQRLAPDVRRYPMSIASASIQDDKPAYAIDVLIPLQQEQPGDQMCNYLLAVALKDYSFSTWTATGENRRAITTREQLAVTKRNITRALGLEFDDDDLQRELLQFMQFAKDAEKLVFRFPGLHVGCLTTIVYVIAIGILLSLAGSHPIIGIPVLAAAGFGWFKLAFRPRWSRDAATLRAQGVTAVTAGERHING
jgi:tetratricopeptide (TPR) repeat protein